MLVVVVMLILAVMMMVMPAICSGYSAAAIFTHSISF